MPEDKTDLVKELEDFEADLAKDNDGVLDPDPNVNVDPDEGKADATLDKDDEGGQKADSDDSTKTTPDEGDDSKATPTDDADATAPKLTTLPDDPETFGELAGKEVTAEQLIEEGFLTKLVTWGHQGRHMVQKGQKELEAAKEEQNELTKLREILEKQVELEEKKAQPKPKEVNEEDFANGLVEHYIPGLKKVAEQGGVETDFIKEFPKAAAHFEHRLQSGAGVLKEIVEKVEEIAKFVGVAQEERATTSARDTYDNLGKNLAEEGALFEPLANKQTRDDLLDWLAAEETGLRVVDKDVSQITSAELQSAWLLYVHSNPDVLKKDDKPAPKKKTDSHLAGGGGGTGSSKAHDAKPTDELSTFEKAFKDAEDEVWNR